MFPVVLLPLFIYSPRSMSLRSLQEEFRLLDERYEKDDSLLSESIELEDAFFLRVLLRGGLRYSSSYSNLRPL